MRDHISYICIIHARDRQLRVSPVLNMNIVVGNIVDCYGVDSSLLVSLILLCLFNVKSYMSAATLRAWS